MHRPSLEKRTFSGSTTLYFVRTVSGWMVSRSTPGEALILFEEQWDRWNREDGGLGADVHPLPILAYAQKLAQIAPSSRRRQGRHSTY